MNLSRYALPALLAWVAMLAGCGSDEPQAPPATTPTPAPAAPSAPASVTGSDSATAIEDPEVLLQQADKAAAEDRLFDPPGDNAFELYLKVIEAAQAGGGGNVAQRRKLLDSVAQVGPEAQARAVLTDLYPYGLVFAERALAQGQREEVERLLNLLARFRDDSPGLIRLRRQLAEAATTPPTAQPQPARPTAPAAVASQPVTTSPPPARPEPAPEPAQPPVQTSPVTPQEPVAAEPTPAPATTPAPAPVSQPTPAPVAQNQAKPATPPKLLQGAQPRYPRIALRRRIEGYVQVRILVQPDGSVGQVEVVDSKPEGVFDREAVDAVKRWKFSTGSEAQWVNQRIDFKLD